MWLMCGTTPVLHKPCCEKIADEPSCTPPVNELCRGYASTPCTCVGGCIHYTASSRAAASSGCTAATSCVTVAVIRVKGYAWWF